MSCSHLRSLMALASAAFLVFSMPTVRAQTPPDQKKEEKPPQGDQSKEGQKKIDEYVFFDGPM